MITYSNRLYGECSRRGWSMRRLGRVVGVSHEAPRRWCDGRARPQRASARKLEELFGLPIDVLMQPDIERGDPE